MKKGALQWMKWNYQKVQIDVDGLILLSVISVQVNLLSSLLCCDEKPSTRPIWRGQLNHINLTTYEEIMPKHFLKNHTKQNWFFLKPNYPIYKYCKHQLVLNIWSRILWLEKIASSTVFRTNSTLSEELKSCRVIQNLHVQLHAMTLIYCILTPLPHLTGIFWHLAMAFIFSLVALRTLMN